MSPRSKGTGIGTHTQAQTATIVGQGTAHGRAATATTTTSSQPLADEMSASAATLPAPKQIRFVNNEGRPPAKRRRVDSACQTCRRRKIRCDGRRPHCSTCELNRHECLGYAAPLLPTPDEKKEVKREKESEDEEEKPVLTDNTPSTKRPPLQVVQGSGSTIKQRVSNDSRDSRDSRDSPGYGFPLRRRSSSIKDDYDEPSSSINRRVNYFRFFGPTAIVKGFKQMVVTLPREPRRSLGPTSLSSASPLSTSDHGGDIKHQNIRRPSVSTGDSKVTPELPSYDIDDTAPVPPLIKHLVEIFFRHLGCNFPFLRRNKVIKMVEERRHAPILVDSICALAARFSENPILIAGRSSKTPRSEYGQVFAQRAKVRVTDAFTYPTVEGLQACLLLAYEAFGDNKDAALWMYTGCAIRMAIDLGLQKLDGIRIQRPPIYSPIDHDDGDSPSHGNSDELEEEKITQENERIDTLWAVFTLDKYISSGLGRPVTMRLEDFELKPPDTKATTHDGWPAPLPALIRVIMLYGKVSDLLNTMRGIEDITDSKVKDIKSLLDETMSVYHTMDHRLIKITPQNFEHYVNLDEGTIYMLFHLWFNTLLMLVHCPLLMNLPPNESYPGNIDTCLSAARNVANLINFGNYIEEQHRKKGRRLSIVSGNPFTSQPMYVAACAFLMEVEIHKKELLACEANSPKADGKTENGDKRSNSDGGTPWNERRKMPTKEEAQHAVADAQSHYEWCHRALQELEVYWAGTRYLITVLNQKAEGIPDPEAFTAEEMESTKIRPGPIMDWKRRLPTPLVLPSPSMKSVLVTNPGASPRPNAAIGGQNFSWSLTNSPGPAFIWPHGSPGQSPSPAPTNKSNYYDPIRASFPEASRPANSTAANMSYHQPYGPHQQHLMGPMLPSQGNYSNVRNEGTEEAEMLLKLAQQNPQMNHRMMGQNNTEHGYGPQQHLSPTHSQQHHAPHPPQLPGAMYNNVGFYPPQTYPGGMGAPNPSPNNTHQGEMWSGFYQPGGGWAGGDGSMAGPPLHGPTMNGPSLSSGLHAGDAEGFADEGMQWMLTQSGILPMNMDEPAKTSANDYFIWESGMMDTSRGSYGAEEE